VQIRLGEADFLFSKPFFFRQHSARKQNTYAKKALSMSTSECSAALWVVLKDIIKPEAAGLHAAIDDVQTQIKSVKLPQFTVKDGPFYKLDLTPATQAVYDYFLEVSGPINAVVSDLNGGVECPKSLDCSTIRGL
jgi:hypothetical protein